MPTWPVIVPARVEQGVVMFNRERLKKLLAGAKDGELTVTIERKHATRSLAQNRLYFGVYCRVLSEHTGYTPEEIHDYLKAKFLPKKIVMADAHGEIVEEVTLGTTTTRLNKIEFGEYLRAIQQWAAETLDVNIPNPEDAL